MGGGRSSLTKESARSQSRSWSGNVTTSFARVEKEQMRREEECIRLRDQRDMVICIRFSRLTASVKLYRTS